MLNQAVLPNADWYLPELYSFLKNMGFTVIINNMSRYVVDVNRSIEYKSGCSYKSSAVYTNTTQGYPIYNQPLSQSEIDNRISLYYNTYHEILQNAILEKQKVFGKSYLIDLHSFGLDENADIVLGTNFGKSCSQKLVNLFKSEFSLNGFKTSENAPFSGGYITKHYGNPLNGCEALQIELWYRSYIESRCFGNEEFPKININLFLSTHNKLKHVFSEFRKYLLKESLL